MNCDFFGCESSANTWVFFPAKARSMCVEHAKRIFETCGFKTKPIPAESEDPESALWD